MEGLPKKDTITNQEKWTLRGLESHIKDLINAKGEPVPQALAEEAIQALRAYEAAALSGEERKVRPRLEEAARRLGLTLRDDEPTP